MNKFSLILAIVVVSFMSGFFISKIAIAPNYDNASNQNTNNTSQTNDEIPENSEKKQRLGQEAQTKYHYLLAEYLEYIKQKEQAAPPSFEDFLSERKDKMIQDNTYTEEDDKLDKEITAWYKGQSSIEKGRDIYTINGTVSNISENSNNDVMVSAYLNKINKLRPTVPIGHIMPEQAIYYGYTEKLQNDFEFNVNLSGYQNSENTSVNVVAALIPNNVPYNLQATMAGFSYETSEIPLSILSKRKDNQPVKIKLKELQKKEDQSKITIKDIYNGAIVSMYGIDLISKLDKDIKISRSTISSSNVAVLGQAPFGSNLFISSNNTNKEADTSKDISFETIINSHETQITLPIKPKCKIGNSCLLIIKPSNMPLVDISIYSKEPRFKKSRSLYGDDVWFIDNVNFKEGILELRFEDNIIGLMRLRPEQNRTTIIEPFYRKIDLFTGKIKKIELNTEKECSNCDLSIRLSEQDINCDKNGVFKTKDISVLDTSINIDVNSNDAAATINILSMYPQKQMILYSRIPTISTINTWNMYAPTTPNNSFLYGEFPYHKSYKAFIIGIDNNTAKQAVYFNSSNLPDKDVYSTDYLAVNPGFGRFLFNDLVKGRYILYLVSNNKIIHSRVIQVEQKRTLVIN